MPNLAVATLKEIARTAKVSIRTVARVTQGKGYVGAKTRAKIDEAIAKLGYSPNLAARSLRTRRSFEIAVLVSSVDELHMDKLAGFSEVLEGTGYRVVIFFSPHLGASPNGEKRPRMPGRAASGASDQPDSEEWADRVLREKPAGVLLFSGGFSFDRALAKKLSSEKIPHVFLDSPAEELSGVSIDRPSGVYEAVHYLWKSGRRRIAFLGPETGADTRLAGFNRALAELGAKPILIHGSSRDEVGVRAIPKKLLASGG
ncbi:MAG: LacI family DNA-binding transcriptional regulator, partial [Spirochaetia bacterium]|nr:LacI family DNA-binding transcriptional regulator [Spirochaetia bacterium]